ncbi:hypothetical protein [Pedobacter aquatilis]|uniref:hypothetical protein n=1 Tax=Pedobacter aquatilis TaxID=351343 RepID=UPI00292CF4A5|nr:hypothetical protein [Pedobacter aquatilis]
MSQGRTSVQIESTNKIMATFLVALLVFIIFTYLFALIEPQSLWIQYLEQKLIAKNS